MENRIVIVSNLKGGCGKSTVCLAMASWLAARRMPVAVVDADLQQTLFRMRQAEVAARPEAAIPWQVAALDITDVRRVRAVVERLRSVPGYVLVDCPGNLSDEGLRPIIEAADMVVTPFSYDRFSLDSTGIFVKVLRHLSQAPLFFVPNRIIATEGGAEYNARRDNCARVFGQIGTVTPRIKQAVAMSRLTTLAPLDSCQSRTVRQAFEAIFG